MYWEPRVGMRVACVISTVRKLYDQGYPPFIKGQVFTIDDVRYIDEYPGAFLHFAERPWRQLGHIAGFRPLDERRLDIFRSILTQAPTEKEPA
ncbi:MAG: hypothetical protein M9939_00835 [Mesorhizobium sp.]|nr:hypothetical protein [Mesorhizobium sp.]MCO5159653.1 hypothetical protein [Mesorhizobium sp.]